VQILHSTTDHASTSRWPTSRDGTSAPSSNHDVPSRSPPVPARPVSISDLVHRDPVAAMLRWPCTRPLLRPRRRP
jgi:hypothetical protein